MSPRRNHPPKRGKGNGGAKNSGDSQEERDFNLGYETIEEHPDGDYRVRRITGSSSTKPYRCPGCDQLIPTATPHTVAWRDEDIESRRHWHNACWAKKNDRKPRTERTRNAPRY